jgi:hypothetical protein
MSTLELKPDLYDHLHLYNSKEQPLSKDLEVINRRSLDAHIKIKPGTKDREIQIKTLKSGD